MNAYLFSIWFATIFQKVAHLLVSIPVKDLHIFIFFTLSSCYICHLEDLNFTFNP